MPAPVKPHPARIGAAALGVVAVFTLAGCAGTVDDAASPEPEDTADAGTGAEPGTAGEPTYADGTYTAEGVYRTPETIEQVTVTVTLAGDVVTAVEVTGDPQTRESVEYQGRFIGGIAEVVEGEDIDDLQVSRVAGSSLTSGGFNEAVEAIKAEAAN